METLNAMLEAMDEYAPKFWQYLKAKAKAMGYENGLPWYELFAPMGKSSTKFTAEQSRDYLVSLFAEFDQELSDMVARAFDENLADDGARPDAIYGDIRFVNELGGRTVRYCRGKWFRPWMFRFAVMVPHPSFYCRRELFDKFGAYSLDYRICADFELVMRYMWKHQIRTKYLNECMVIMRTGGASTAGIRSSILINKEDLKALKRNGYWSSLWLIYLKYIFKIWGFLIRF
jgi:hypothetical protein